MPAGSFLDDVFAFLLPEERRIVLAHCLDKRSLAEVAKEENIDMATATARYQSGIEKLRQVEAEQQRAGVIVIPEELGGGTISLELFESTWKKVAERLGLPEALESEPPPSGTRSR